MNTLKPLPCISIQDFKKQYDAGIAPCFIDVREDSEWQEMHIPGATHIPKANLLSEPMNYFSQLNEPIYLYCHSGVRSLYAAYALIAMGFTKVYSMDGGIVAWGAAGYPVKS
jgi:rhodanese-related sulfurtransferase